MARLKKDAGLDLTVTHELTVDRIDRLTCPPGVLKAFLRDSDVTGLKVRVTANAAKAFVYEAKLGGKAISRTLGRWSITTIEEAKAKARDLQRTVKSDKQDPRELERRQSSETAAQALQALASAVTVGAATIVEGGPKRRDAWKPRYVIDMTKMAHPGVVSAARQP